MGISPEKILDVILFVVIVLAFMTSLIPVANNSLSNFTTDNSGVPLASIFTKNGIVILLLMAAVVIGIVRLARFGGKK